MISKPASRQAFPSRGPAFQFRRKRGCLTFDCGFDRLVDIVIFSPRDREPQGLKSRRLKRLPGLTHVIAPSRFRPLQVPNHLLASAIEQSLTQSLPGQCGLKIAQNRAFQLSVARERKPAVSSQALLETPILKLKHNPATIAVRR